MNSSGRNNNVIIILVFVLLLAAVSFVLLGGGDGLSFANMLKLAGGRTEVEAEIVGVETRDGGQTIEIGYEYAGAKYRSKMEVTGQEYKTGYVVAVYIDPDNPEEVFASRGGGAGVILMVAGLLLAAAGMFILSRKNRRANNKKRGPGVSRFL